VGPETDGGHVYQYTATSLSDAKELMHETLEKWGSYVHTRIDEFGGGEVIQ
jgi:predicted transcriptional regulator